MSDPAERRSVTIWVPPWELPAYIIIGKLPSGSEAESASKMRVHSLSDQAVISPSAMNSPSPALRNISLL